MGEIQPVKIGGEIKIDEQKKHVKRCAISLDSMDSQS